MLPRWCGGLRSCGIWALLVVAVGSGGCASTANLKADETAVPDRPPPVSPIAPILEMMSILPQGDPAQQAEIFQAAKDAADANPTTSNRLRYALALATPGHSGTDPVAAERQLSELLARPETLLSVERLLAVVELREVEQQLVLQAEAKRLQDEASHDSRDKIGAANRRLASEIDENARLRKALEEALAKLEAVTHIERAINEPGSNTPPAGAALPGTAAPAKP